MAFAFLRGSQSWLPSVSHFSAFLPSSCFHPCDGRTAACSYFMSRVLQECKVQVLREIWEQASRTLSKSTAQHNRRLKTGIMDHPERNANILKVSTLKGWRTTCVSPFSPSIMWAESRNLTQAIGWVSVSRTVTAFVPWAISPTYVLNLSLFIRVIYLWISAPGSIHCFLFMTLTAAH